MSQIASHGGGNYYFASTSDLADLYQDIADMIINATYSKQTIVNAENIDTVIYPDSYIEINYTPTFYTPKQGDIEVNIQTDQFGNCTADVALPNKPNFRYTEGKILSYSGDHWTSLIINNESEVVFNLTKYDDNYLLLGDPFIVYVPQNKLYSENKFKIVVGDNPSNLTNCSLNNSMIYNAYIQNTFTGILSSEDEGCNWTIEFDDGEEENFVFPENYNGTKVCYFNSTFVNYSNKDTYDNVIIEFLDTFDYDDNNMSNINFKTEEIEIESFLYTDVPHLWGPALIEVHIWD
jgi:hypothetical protein